MHRRLPIKTVVAAAVVALSGCSMIKVQVPGVQTGGSSSSSGGGLTGSSSKKLSLDPPKEGHATVSNMNNTSDLEHDLNMGRGPQRLADCDKTKADPNGAQPSEDELAHLQKGLSFFGTGALNLDGRIKSFEALDDYEKVVADSKAKYGPWWCSATVNGQPGVSAHEQQVLKLYEKIALFKIAEWGDPKVSKAELDKAIAKADSGLQEYVKAKQIHLEGKGDSLTSSGNFVQQAINEQAKYYALQLKMMEGANAPDVVASNSAIDSENAKVKQAISEIQDAMADTFPMPKDTYKGKDAATVKAAFAKYFADKKVLKVVLVSDWERKVGDDWLGDKLVHFDHSWIQGNIVVKADDKNAEVWKVICRQDHLDHDKLKFDTYIPENLGKMRLKNVK